MVDVNSSLMSGLSGLILAGGEGRRMAGRDKGLISLAQKPLVEYAIECMAPLVDDLSISCNRNRELYQDYQLACISDELENYQGPMAGLAAGLRHAKHDWLLVMPCDTPLMTSHVMAQLLDCLKTEKTRNSLQAILFSHQGLQPLHGLYHKSMLPIFEQCLAENKNALQRLLRSMDSIHIHQALDAELSFNNANDPEELHTIECLLADNEHNV
ncbi:MAG: molybdenum cofactor guanylyltransferase [Oleispira antarctica]|uniref:Molybdenum cofactor guanylyltransferase n=1 Tax=Oleispira antarctica RB-8 TaxID=698738 RepID=R4YN42_OLEAN|nr:molybdenum cofactor guanylyltransferase [Oleispira antarctica]MBQ0793811.1 molybdenum cofactor guanylyltransferase [Oleispira antarctica]CCK74483.1 Probable molybdopterin-guanine dinucleotide biosynthesis protein A [Oleispira antarctica RB-8]|tara:strand:- start:818 stop:1456 length:639 start_codon:yes stop_codon:yes gene_type:complete